MLASYHISRRSPVKIKNMPVSFDIKLRSRRHGARPAAGLGDTGAGLPVLVGRPPV